MSDAKKTVIVIVGIVAVLGLIYLAYWFQTKPARDFGKAGSDFASGIADWHKDVDSAKSIIDKK